VRPGLAYEFQEPVEDGVTGAGVHVDRGGDAVVVDEQTALGQLDEGAGPHQVGGAGELVPRGVPGQQIQPGGQRQRAVGHGASSRCDRVSR
jgi:hypothetical protein